MHCSPFLFPTKTFMNWDQMLNPLKNFSISFIYVVSKNKLTSKSLALFPGRKKKKLFGCCWNWVSQGEDWMRLGGFYFKGSQYILCQGKSRTNARMNGDNNCCFVNEFYYHSPSCFLFVYKDEYYWRHTAKSRNSNNKRVYINFVVASNMMGTKRIGS